MKTSKKTASPSKTKKHVTLTLNEVKGKGLKAKGRELFAFGSQRPDALSGE